MRRRGQIIGASAMQSVLLQKSYSLDEFARSVSRETKFKVRDVRRS
jgi:hypothetical protein